METRSFGRNGLQVSVLGFGCGAVGGLMLRGTEAEQERAISRALDAGITYFDTAALYGDGASEQNLGKAVRRIKPRRFVYGTKVRIQSARKVDICEAITASVEASLRRLGMERCDILHLHNPITEAGAGNSLTFAQVADDVIPAFQTLRAQGKIGVLGLTATGDTGAVLKAIGTGAFESAQVSYNMLNPSAAIKLPSGYPAQDYQQLFAHTQANGTGVIGIRILAGGALSGSDARAPYASPPPDPIGSASSFERDLSRARRFLPLVDEGYATSLSELATRFALSSQAMGSALMGLASLDQLEQAIAAAERGPLPAAALARIGEIQASFAGEAR